MENVHNIKEINNQHLRFKVPYSKHDKHSSETSTTTETISFCFTKRLNSDLHSFNTPDPVKWIPKVLIFHEMLEAIKCLFIRGINCLHEKDVLNSSLPLVLTKNFY